jgi:hypothetical protein
MIFDISPSGLAGRPTSLTAAQVEQLHRLGSSWHG